MTSSRHANQMPNPPIRRLEIELTRPWEAVPGAAEGGTPAGGVQILVRLHGAPIGLVTAPLTPAGYTAAELRELVEPAVAEARQAHLWWDEQPVEWSSARDATEPRCARLSARLNESGPAVDVVIPTRDRPERLAACVDSILATGYANLHVIVVDNKPSGPETAQLVASRGDWRDRVEYVFERRAGLSLARNRGAQHATADYVAFVDDDVTVDPGWASGMVRAFLEEPEAGCVTGPIIAAELETKSQMWIEEYGGFSKGFVRRVYDPHDSAGEVPLFPYAAGTYGSGANSAFRRDTFVGIRGFDTALGLGTPARGGEDLAAFAAALLSGRRLVYEPAMMVRHRHHAGYDKLRQVILGYGIGLGAYLAKTAFDRPSTVIEFARRVPPGLTYLLSPDSPKNAHKTSGYPRELTVRELAGLAWGPFAYTLGKLELRGARTPKRRSSQGSIR